MIDRGAVGIAGEILGGLEPEDGVDLVVLVRASEETLDGFLGKFLIGGIEDVFLIGKGEIGFKVKFLVGKFKGEGLEGLVLTFVEGTPRDRVLDTFEEFG